MDGKLLPLVVFCYFLYTSVTSFILSLVLLSRYTLGQFYGFFASRVDDDTISLYGGTVIYDRRHPVNHYFKTPIRFALIDLDRSSYIPPNHLSSKEARSIAGTNGPVLLLTMPPSVGYQRSPFSLYYCYDLQESSSKILNYCIAEVKNSPWGEQAQFIFNPNSDLVAKSLHISPFMSFQLLLKNVQFLEHPKYKKPEYIEESLKAAQGRGCCMAFPGNSDKNPQADARDRWYSWKQVKWPWV